jgi:hypothetical protein
MKLPQATGSDALMQKCIGPTSGQQVLWTITPGLVNRFLAVRDQNFKNCCPCEIMSHATEMLSPPSEEDQAFVHEFD